MLNKLFIFAVGITAGSAVTYIALKEKYEILAQEEIASVKETFRENLSKIKEQEKMNTDYETIIHNYISNNDEKEEKDSTDKPYVISPDEFGEFEEYEIITLTYYSDDILTDDCDEPVENIDEVVGLEALTHFGEYEDDAVYVRNDRLKCDYEILRDDRQHFEEKR